jgi:large conductance mechanosensitive channel
MPFISLLTNRTNFTDKFIALDGGNYATLADAQAQGVATVNYGLFISGIINFIIMAFVVFLLVRWINKLKKQYR